jgi:hypothetical protein
MRLPIRRRIRIMSFSNRKIEQEAVITRLEQGIADLESLKREYEGFVSLPLVVQLAIEHFSSRVAGIHFYELEDRYRMSAGYEGDTYADLLQEAIAQGHLIPKGDGQRFLLSDVCRGYQENLMKVLKEGYF